MRVVQSMAAFAVAGLVTGCGSVNARGVDDSETLLSVMATGDVETRPDRAEFQAGMESFGATGSAASEANEGKIAALVTGLRAAGVDEKDIQTRAMNIQRIQYGDRKGQYQASNVVNVTVRDIDRASAAVTAATEAGANVMSGPAMQMSDVETAANGAYANAFKAARARADAYAEAAGMEVSRVLTIRDAGGRQGDRYLPGAVPPPPVSAQTTAIERTADASMPFMPGQTASQVAVQVDFALRPK